MAEADSTVDYRDIQGHPGYRVGSDGSVWSAWRRIGLPDRRGSTVLISDRWKRMKARPHPKTGYHCVILRGPRTRLVHRLVLEAFVGPCPDGMEACHFPDRDRANNRLNNLRWDTKKANQADRVAHGTDMRGEAHPRSKMSDDVVRAIRVEYARGGTSHARLALKYGVDKSSVGLVIRRRIWAHVE